MNIFINIQTFFLNLDFKTEPKFHSLSRMFDSSLVANLPVRNGVQFETQHLNLRKIP